MPTQAICTALVEDAESARRHTGRMAKKGIKGGHPPNRIRYWREKRGLTLEQLGKRMGVTHATISRWETSNRSVTVDKLLKLAQELGCHPGELIAEMDHGGEKGKRAVALAFNLDEDQLAAWFQVGDTMAKPRSDDDRKAG